MGNQPSSSRSQTPTSNPPQSSPQSPSVTLSHAPATLHHATSSHSREPNAANPRRRESIQALSIKASAAPPSASLESAAAHPASARPPSRGRSQTIASASGSTTAAVAHQLRAAHDHRQLREKSASEENMGNEQSRHKGYVHGHQHQHQLQHQHHHGQHGQHPSDTAPPKPKLPAPPPIHPQQQQQQPAPSPQTQPVDVPSLPKDESYGGGSRSAHASSIDPADASEFFIQPSQYSRPPRLPLPIEEEVHTPGSPIISPVDLTAPIAIDQADTDGVLPRRASVSSSTTVEEDALADDYQPVSNQPTVPTVIEWEGPGDRVYVTGTFAGWNKKYRLHKNGPSPKKDVLSTVINIIPGTHHLKFIVDNDMRTSDKLPTAVDYTNILVNYLEVSLDDLPQQATDTPKEPQQPEPAPVQELRAPPGIYPPQTLPPTPELLPVAQPEPVPVLEPPKPKTPVNTVVSPKRYHQRIPRYLLDLDAPEESSRMARASAATSNLPTPPSLPMFLSKSILNGTTPMKDDSSVLILPNHTVLNHLATSSIKDNILATSATTRYKQKFLTTVMYKPKNDDPDRERN